MKCAISMSISACLVANRAEAPLWLIRCAFWASSAVVPEDRDLICVAVCNVVARALRSDAFDVRLDERHIDHYVDINRTQNRIDIVTRRL